MKTTTLEDPDGETDTVTKYIDGIKHALAQHAVCSIARDAASKYPNVNRVARGASNAIEAINQLDAISTTQTNMLPAITKQLNASNLETDIVSKMLATIEDINTRLKKANL